MKTICIEISRDNLYSSNYASSKRTAQTDETSICNYTIAYEFLYRFFAEVIAP